MSKKYQMVYLKLGKDKDGMLKGASNMLSVERLAQYARWSDSRGKGRVIASYLLMPTFSCVCRRDVEVF